MRFAHSPSRFFFAGRFRSRSSLVHGFILLELLVVAVLLSLLMLMIVPALARTKSPAARTKCADNLRMMMQGVAMFAMDNRDSLPLPNWGSGSGTGWLYAPGFGGKPPSGSDPSSVSGTLWPFVKLKDAYMCPLDFNSRYYSTRDNKLSTYKMNGAVCGFGLVWAYSLNQFKPEAYCMLEPKDGPFAYSDGAIYPWQNEGPGRNHAGGTPVGTFGGAAVFPTFLYLQNLQAGTGPNLVWCSPGTSDGH